MTIPFIAALLLFGSLTAAQDDHVSNFQVASRNSTHITFSWDIVDGYYSSSYISYFRLYYQRRSYSYASYVYISYSSATHNGATFSYTHSLETFNNGPYIMWVQVRRPSLDPSYTYSGRKHVKIGFLETYFIILELKVHLHPTQNCSDILVRRNSFSSVIIREVRWIIQENCQCYLPYYFSVQGGHITCTASDYVIFRTKLSPSDSMNEMDLASVKSNLSNLLSRQDRKTYITVYESRYFIEPGPCGLTVPQLYSPHCLDNTPTQQDPVTTTATTTVTTTATSHQDNTAVSAVVSIMIVSMVLVVLCGGIVFFVIGLRKMNRRQTNAPKVKASHDLEMASEGCSRSIPALSRDNDPVYTNSDMLMQSNPSYGILK